MSSQRRVLVYLYVSSSVVSFALHAAPPCVLGFLISKGMQCAVGLIVEFIKKKKNVVSLVNLFHSNRPRVCWTVRERAREGSEASIPCVRGKVKEEKGK